MKSNRVCVCCHTRYRTNNWGMRGLSPLSPQKSARRRLHCAYFFSIVNKCERANISGISI
jgi:hypothetical protein